MTDMQISVRFRWKPGLNGLNFTGSKVTADLVADKITGFCGGFARLLGHVASFGLWEGY